MPLPTTRDLIAALRDPSFYPHDVGDRVEIVQTHISIVALTGEYAYKLKKSVDLGFLDYSSLEKRRHFCHEELRLNQRGAAEIYLDVVAIAQTSNGLQLRNGFYETEAKELDGEIVEYALKMRQFPQSSLFVNLFESGELSAADLEDLGQVVARYHAGAATNDYIRSFGERDRIFEAINGNYGHTEKFIGSLQSRQRFEETKQFTDEFGKRHLDWFEARIEGDKIRECHGDLHLKNIARWQDKILLFDCIEFNEPFRFVDVMYDVAFAVMDLEARHRLDLGNAFLNTYLEQTGDWEGGALAASLSLPPSLRAR